MHWLSRVAGAVGVCMVCTLCTAPHNTALLNPAPASTSPQPYRTELRPGEIQLYLGQRRVRSYPTPAGSAAQTLLLPGRLVIAGDDGREQYFLHLFDIGNSGNRLVLGKVGAGTVTGLYSRAQTLFLQLSSSAGAGISSFTLAQSLTSNSSTIIPGWRVAEVENSVLFDGTDATYTPYEPVTLRYFRFDLTRQRLIPVRFKVPARRGCGPVDRDTSRGENDAVDQRRLLAVRHDRCGVFQTSFDWTLGARQQPTVTPVYKRVGSF